MRGAHTRASLFFNVKLGRIWDFFGIKLGQTWDKNAKNSCYNYIVGSMQSRRRQRRSAFFIAFLYPSVTLRVPPPFRQGRRKRECDRRKTVVKGWLRVTN